MQLSVAVHVAVDGASCRSNDQIMPSAVIPDSVDVIDAGSFAQRGVIGGEGEAGVVDADVENFKGTINNLPTREMIDVPVNEMLIVELYSK